MLSTSIATSDVDRDDTAMRKKRPLDTAHAAGAGHVIHAKTMSDFLGSRYSRLLAFLLQSRQDQATS